MRISTGMAEISFQNIPGSRIASEQFYVWPLYNAGRVESIHGVTRRTDSNITYTKPSQEDREKIMGLANERSFNEYSSAGRIGRAHGGLQPGSLFDAIAVNRGSRRLLIHRKAPVSFRQASGLPLRCYLMTVLYQTNKKPALSSGFATGGIPFLVCSNLFINHQEAVKSSLFSDLPEPALQYHSGQVSDLWTDLPLIPPCQHPGCGFRMPVYFHRRSSVLSR